MSEESKEFKGFRNDIAGFGLKFKTTEFSDEAARSFMEGLIDFKQAVSEELGIEFDIVAFPVPKVNKVLAGKPIFKPKLAGKLVLTDKLGNIRKVSEKPKENDTNAVG